MFHRIAPLVACGLLLTASLLAAPAAYAGDYGAEPSDRPWRGSTKDDGYPAPVPPPPAGYEPPRAYREAPRRHVQCLSRPGLRAALNDQGWHNFDHVDYRGDVAFMTADNDRGRRFEVEFDACSGEVVRARPVEVYVERPAPPPVYYGYGYYGPPRPYVGVYVGPYPYGHRHWR